MLNVQGFPDGTNKSAVFRVSARISKSDPWTEVPCMQIYTGHQKGEWEYSSLSVMDFDGTIYIQVQWLPGRFTQADIRPHEYSIDAETDEVNGTIQFQAVQDPDSPIKLVIRIDDSWGTGLLHLLTNPIELTSEKPDPKGENVYRIRSGDAVPEILPEGKDTYYFDEGMHILPKGLWAVVDLEGSKQIDRFVILQGGFKLDDCSSGDEKKDPLSFVIEAKESGNAAWQILFDGRDNIQSGIIEGSFNETACSKVRLKLLGTTSEKGWVFSALVSSFQLYGPDGEEDLAAGKACDGGIPDYRNLTDGDPKSLFTGKYRSAAWHAGESFFISRPGTKIYLAPGAMVNGAIAAEGIDDIRIYGRGILDGSRLLHEADPGEARTGAVWITGGKDICVEGITVLDAPMWQIVLNYDENVVVKNINLLGYVVNADGIHVSGTKGALIQGCFVRSCDDLIVAYHYGKTEDITVKNCVFLNDDAHVFLFGLGETKDAYIKQIRIEKCCIISQQEAPWEPYRFSGVFKFWAHGGNVIEDVRISDIYIDSFRYPEKGCLFQLRTERRFSGETPGKGISNVHFKNIFIESTNESASLISTAGEKSFIKNISFSKVYRGGKEVKTIEDLNVNIEGNTKDIQITGEV